MSTSRRRSRLSKPIPAPKMWELLVKYNGAVRAYQLAETYSVKSFKDSKGNPLGPNPDSNYWEEVKRLIKKNYEHELRSITK